MVEHGKSAKAILLELHRSKALIRDVPVYGQRV